MDVITYSDAAEFAEAARPVLERHPAHASILATTLDQAITGHLLQDDALWLLIGDARGPIGAAMQTPPHNLFLTPLPDAVRAAAIPRLADSVGQADRDLPGVTAPAADAEAFAGAWRERTGCRSRLALAEVLYEIR